MKKIPKFFTYEKKPVIIRSKSFKDASITISRGHAHVLYNLEIKLGNAAVETVLSTPTKWYDNINKYKGRVRNVRAEIKNIV